MQKPNYIFDREFIKNQRYLFVSYSHSDKEEVYQILAALYQLGVNYWYDKGLDVGDIWDEKVKIYIESESCIGAIVFLSMNSCVSEAVVEEVKIINQLRAENKNFHVIPILLDATDIDNLFGNVMLSKKDMNFRSQKMSIFEKLIEQNKMIYSVHTKLEQTTADILDIAKKCDVTEEQVFHIKETNLLRVKGCWLEGNQCFLRLGSYPQSSCGEIKEIQWTLIKQEENLLYFATTYTIDFVKMCDIEQLEKKVFESVKSIGYIEAISIIDEDIYFSSKDLLGKFIPTDYADSNRAQFLRTFWIRKKSNKSSYLICNSNGEIVRLEGVLENINCGVRLILKIDTNKIKENS